MNALIMLLRLVELLGYGGLALGLAMFARWVTR